MAMLENATVSRNMIIWTRQWQSDGLWRTETLRNMIYSCINKIKKSTTSRAFFFVIPVFFFLQITQINKIW